MYKYMQKYSKKVMAVLSIFLMITFVVQQSTKSGNDRMDPAVATVAGQEIKDSELKRAKSEWEFLNRNAAIFQQYEPYPGLPPQRGLQPVGVLLGRQAMQQIQLHPELYLLLQKEAQNMGVSLNVERLETMLRNQVYTRGADDKAVPAADAPDPEIRNNLRIALANFLLVQSAFDRAASTLKISEPLRQYDVAARFQSIMLNLVDFPARDYEAKVPPPTAQQLDEQFKKYADIDPDMTDPKTNPFGFSYRYGDRVKLQYITIPRADLIAVAEKSRSRDDKTQYEWDRDAFKYYQANAHLYQTTQPAASTQPAPFSLDPNAKAPAGPGPTTKPFDQIKADARKKVLEADAAKLSETIEQRITSQMAADYQAYASAAGGTTHPATAPSTKVGGARYDTYDYLQKLAAQIQGDYKVLPQTTALDKDYLSEKELGALPGIGTAFTSSSDFPRFAVSAPQLFASTDQQDTSRLLNLYQPSSSFHDGADNIYIFRLTDAQKAHAPADKSEVLAKVEADYRASKAMDLAAEDAKKFMASAQSTSLESAAKAAGSKPIIAAGPISGSVPTVPNYTLDEASRPQFIRDAFQLLRLANASTPHPLTVIQIPHAGKAVVAQLADVTARWSAENYHLAQASASQALSQELRQVLEHDWFNYDNVASRLDFHEFAKPKNPRHTPPATPLNQPLF